MSKQRDNYSYKVWNIKPNGKIIEIVNLNKSE